VLSGIQPIRVQILFLYNYEAFFTNYGNNASWGGYDLEYFPEEKDILFYIRFF
jgi:hypothetical protein